MTDLLTMPHRFPRTAYFRERHGPHLRIGLLIDWLESRPDHGARDTKVLWSKIEHGDLEVRAAAAIIGIAEPWEANMVVKYPRDYFVYFHDQIAGHLEADEVFLGEQVYRRLHILKPDCMSALVNLAELERRAGREPIANDLLGTALDLAISGRSERYGINDSAWEPPIRCALARLARHVGDAAPFLELARRDQLSELTNIFNNLERITEPVVQIHRAFSVASPEQRIVLHAAMDLAGIWPAPPPAAHGDFAATLAVDELVRQHKAKAPKEVRYLFGPPVADSPSSPRFTSLLDKLGSSSWTFLVLWTLILVVLAQRC